MDKSIRPVARPRSKTGEVTKHGRPLWKEEATGEYFSEKTITVPYGDGWVVMPTVAEDGSQYDEDVIAEYVKQNGPIDFITGEELPVFESVEQAATYAENRSDTMLDEKAPVNFAKGGIKMEQQMSFFEDGGLKDEGGMIDEVSGNDVPSGSTRKEVRDDIPAMLSEGEFVFPADVVRYLGLDRLMQLRQEAKMGLKRMEAMGQMGNSDEATIPDDLPFDVAELIIVDSEEPEEMNMGGMPMKFAEGGVPNYKQLLEGQDISFTKPQGRFTEVPTGAGFTLPAYSTGARAASPAGTGAITIKTFKNAQGIELPIPFSGNQPLYPIPYGFTESTAATSNATQQVKPVTAKEMTEDDRGGGVDVAPQSTVPTAEEIANMTEAELNDLANDVNSLNNLSLMGLANPVMGIIGRAIAKDYKSRVQDPIAQRAKALNIPNPLDQAKTKTNIIDKIKSIFTKKDEEEEKTKEDKTKQAIPTLEPTPQPISKTNIDFENLESTFNFSDDDLAMAQNLLGDTQSKEDFKDDMLALAAAQNLTAEDTVMAQDVVTPTTPNVSMDEAITGIDANQPGQLTGGKDVGKDVVNAVAMQAAISRAANVESKIGLDVFGPPTTSPTPTGLSEEGRGYANPPSNSANLTGIENMGTDFSQPDADTGKDTAPSVSISAASPNISGAMSAARSGFGTSKSGEFGGTPTDTSVNNAYSGLADAVGIDTSTNAPSGNYGGGDPSVPGGQTSAGPSFGTSPGGEFEGSPTAADAPSNASPDPSVAGAEVGTGEDGTDAVGPFNRGGLAARKTKPAKRKPNKDRGLAARKKK